MEVHRQLGFGFLEAVYHQALRLEFAARSIPFESEVSLTVYYKGQALESYFKADFICFGAVLVEIKAQSALTSADEAQLLNYLTATGLEIGLLINFGAESLEYKRIVRNRSRHNFAHPSAKSAQSAKSADLLQDSGE
jgi:GxxExxY protein